MGKGNTNFNEVTMASSTFPHTLVSEEIIEQEGPSAIAYLKRMGKDNEEIREILGLSHCDGGIDDTGRENREA